MYDREHLEKIFGMEVEVIFEFRSLCDTFNLKPSELLDVVRALILEDIYDKKVSMETLDFYIQKYRKEQEKAFKTAMEKSIKNFKCGD